jgi:hypothetical protein
MSNCGESLLSLTRRKKYIEITDHREQALCISRNLKQNNILHCDLNPRGNNLCINEVTKCLSVIDFDWVQLDGYKKSNHPINSSERLDIDSWGENLLLQMYENYLRGECLGCEQFGFPGG